MDDAGGVAERRLPGVGVGQQGYVAPEFQILNASTAINFAQGEFVMIGGMAAVAFVDAGLPLPLSIVFAVGLAALVGLAGVFALWRFWPGGGEPEGIPTPTPKPTSIGKRFVVIDLDAPLPRQVEELARRGHRIVPSERPMFGFGVALWAMVRHFGRMDEYLRRVQLQPRTEQTIRCAPPEDRPDQRTRHRHGFLPVEIARKLLRHHSSARCAARRSS